jgi:ribosomal protein S27AE
MRNKEEKDYAKTVNVSTDYNRVDIEQPVTERVIIYKDSYDVPKEKRMICPNCNNIIDKNAFICLKCGYLLRDNVFAKKEEPRVYNDQPRYNYEPVKKTNPNLYINIGLIIAIVICLIMIINIAMERGIIG